MQEYVLKFYYYNNKCRKIKEYVFLDNKKTKKIKKKKHFKTEFFISFLKIRKLCGFT